MQEAGLLVGLICEFMPACLEEDVLKYFPSTKRTHKSFKVNIKLAQLSRCRMQSCAPSLKQV